MGKHPVTTTAAPISPPDDRLQLSRPWPTDYAQALQLQGDLASRVIDSGGVTIPYLAAGADLHIRRSDGMGIAAVVAVSVPDLSVVEKVTAAVPVEFPYIPGLLSFRELPALLEALSRLRARPDVVLVDGHGRSHPRRFGLACHLGLELDVATVGCAKSRLVGNFENPGTRAGSISYLELDDERMGIVLRSKERCRPLFVSVGHRIGLDAALQVVKENLDGYKIPLALRLAHTMATADARA